MVVVVVFCKVMINMFSTIVVVTSMSIGAPMQGVKIVMVVHFLASVPLVMRLVKQVLSNDLSTSIMSHGKLVLQRILMIIAVGDIVQVLVVEAVGWIVILIVTITAGVIHVAVGVMVLRVVDKLCMRSLDIHARVVLELCLVMYWAHIIRLCVVGMIVHCIVLVVLVEPVLEDLVLIVRFVNLIVSLANNVTVG